APGITVSCLPGLDAVTGCSPGLPLLLTANSPPRGSAFGWRSGDLQLDLDDSAFLPNASLQWEPRSDLMLYVSYSEGFKAGGFDQRNLFLDAQSGPFGPERVTAWELGLKSRLQDGDLQLNLAMFNSHYRDLQ